MLVVDKTNKLVYREVELGPNHDGLRVVRKGLKPGETIVVNGLQRVRPGDTVQPKPVAMAFRSELEPRGTTPDRKQAASEKGEAGVKPVS
ncbi:Efflux pump periplasmic linker BepF [compost metagenome]